MSRNRPDPILRLKPSDIRFTQDTILNKFQDKNKIDDVINDVINNRLDVIQIPKIRVVMKDNHYWSLDNRRLYAFRVLECQGAIHAIDVRLVPLSRLPEEKFTTENEGLSIRIRRGHTRKHVMTVDQAKPNVASPDRMTSSVNPDTFIPNFLPNLPIPKFNRKPRDDTERLISKDTTAPPVAPVQPIYEPPIPRIEPPRPQTVSHSDRTSSYSSTSSDDIGTALRSIFKCCFCL